MEKHWICCCEAENSNNVLMQFRKEFENPSENEIIVRIHANLYYKLFLNGRFICRGMAPSCTAYPYFEEKRLSCEKGKVCLAVVLYGPGENIILVTEQNKGPVALNMEVCIGRERYVTDTSWKCRLAPDYFRETMLDPMANRISAWGGFKEIYDTRKSDEDWVNVGYDDSNWDNAVVGTRANQTYGALLKYDLPQLAEGEKLLPKLIQRDCNLGSIEIRNGKAVLHTDVPGSFPAVIYDFGKETVGYPRICVKGDEGGSLSVWYGESIDTVRCDTFILNGKEQTLSPFNRRAFRYIKLTANGGSAVTIESIFVRTVHFPLKEEPISFENAMLDRVYQTSLYTTKLASQYHFEDSVYREQAQWLLDSRMMALVHYECFHETRLAEKAIRQFCRTQRKDGSICAMGPMECNQLLPDFCLHFVLMVEEYVRYSGKEADEEIRVALAKLFDWLEDNEDDGGLLNADGKQNWWCFIDWAPIEKRGNVTALNCLYYSALKAYAKILCREADVSKRYALKADRVRDSVNRTMFCEEKGLYCDCVANGEKSASCSQQSNMYALISGVAMQPEELCKKTISDDFEGTKINGAFMMCLCVDYLLEKGYTEKATEWIGRYWGEMLARGATTWWETFDMSTPHSSVPYAYSTNNATYMHEYIPVSYCHAWGAGIAYSLKKWMNFKKR